MSRKNIGITSSPSLIPFLFPLLIHKTPPSTIPPSLSYTPPAKNKWLKCDYWFSRKGNMSRGIWIGWAQNGCRGKVGYKWCNMTYHLGIHKDQISFHRSPNHFSSLIDIIEFQMIYASSRLIKPELLYCVQCTQSQCNFNYKYIYYMQKN